MHSEGIVRQLSAAAAHWAGRVRGMAEADAPSMLLCVALLFCLWRAWWLDSTPQTWAVEHQTNTAGQDVIIRCRDESFCPIPGSNAGSPLVDIDTDP